MITAGGLWQLSPLSPGEDVLSGKTLVLTKKTMKINKNIFYSLILIIISIIACGIPKPLEMNIINIERDTIAVFKTNDNSITTITIEAKGYIDDTCQVNSIKLIPGKIDTTLRRIECYSKDIHITYKAYKATKGKLALKIFHP